MNSTRVKHLVCNNLSIYRLISPHSQCLSVPSLLFSPHGATVSFYWMITTSQTRYLALMGWIYISTQPASSSSIIIFLHDDVVTWKPFLHYWSLGCRFPLQNARNIELWWLHCHQSEQDSEQTIKLLVIWDAMMLIWHHSNEHIICIYSVTTSQCKG